MKGKPASPIGLLGGGPFSSRRAILRAVAWLAGVVIAGVMFLTVIDAVLYPWAHSFTGGPTLTGVWYGELPPAAAGGRHVLYVELRASLNRQTRSGNRLDGTARICDDRGQVREFDVDGNPMNWRGTSFWMSTGLTDNRDGRGVQLGRLEGQLDGDTIHGRATLVFYDVERGVARAAAERSRGDDRSDQAEPVVPLVLRRGSEREFLAACSRLGENGRSADR